MKYLTKLNKMCEPGFTDQEKSVMAGLTRQLCMPMASIGNNLFTALAVIRDGGSGSRQDNKKGRKCLPDSRQVNCKNLTNASSLTPIKRH